jgi:hypothetical protein
MLKEVVKTHPNSLITMGKSLNISASFQFFYKTKTIKKEAGIIFIFILLWNYQKLIIQMYFIVLNSYM